MSTPHDNSDKSLSSINPSTTTTFSNTTEPTQIHTSSYQADSSILQIELEHNDFNTSNDSKMLSPADEEIARWRTRPTFKDQFTLGYWKFKLREPDLRFIETAFCVTIPAGAAVAGLSFFPRTLQRFDLGNPNSNSPYTFAKQFEYETNYTTLKRYYDKNPQTVPPEYKPPHVPNFALTLHQLSLRTKFLLPLANKIYERRLGFHTFWYLNTFFFAKMILYDPTYPLTAPEECYPPVFDMAKTLLSCLGYGALFGSVLSIPFYTHLPIYAPKLFERYPSTILHFYTILVCSQALAVKTLPRTFIDATTDNMKNLSLISQTIAPQPSSTLGTSRQVD